MQDEQLLAGVRELRAAGASTNHIARVLGVPRGRIAPLVRELGREERPRAAEPPVLGCWVSAGWSAGLTVDAARSWPDGQRSPTVPVSGLVGVLVARGPRSTGGEVSACGYLVDTYCLGVKDALPPRRMRERRLPDFVDRFFDGFGTAPVEAPIELARHLVWGAVEYARGLGFEPHPDLRLAAGHLGPLTEPCAIGFGRDGKPYYVQGLSDDPDRVLRTLHRTVGQDNYHFLVGVDAFELA
ncbi:MAG: hypothetical protein EA387_12740 [Nitriliruptor sp.]|nr:MAG: hypothetical protein EA387_12740 [Nitriliruptor sp.]